MHSSAKGTLVAKLRLATNEYARDDDGNRQDSVEYHSAVAFGKLAGVCQEFVTRGKLIYLEGRLRTREWEGKDGFRRYTTEIVETNAASKAAATKPKPRVWAEPEP
jgi:single-strand DNA-binding protein